MTFRSTLGSTQPPIQCVQMLSYSWNRPWRSIGLWDVETLTFLGNRLTDGGEVVSLTRRPVVLYPPSHRKIPGTHFCYSLSRPQGHSAAGRIRSTENSNDLIRNRTVHVFAFNTVPQPTTLPVRDYFPGGKTAGEWRLPCRSWSWWGYTSTSPHVFMALCLINEVQG
jgi:hypothetical protein